MLWAGYPPFRNKSYGHLFGFDLTENNATRSADPENLMNDTNMKWIGWSVAEIQYGNSKFSKWEVDGWVGRSVLNIYFHLILLIATLGTLNVSREE